MFETMACIVLAAACALAGADPETPGPLPAPPRTGPPIGFVTHLHAPGHEDMAGFPVSAELGDVFHWRVEPFKTDEPGPEDIRVEFDGPDAWLERVRGAGRQAYVILDTAVHHTSYPWRHEMTGRAGQNMAGSDGRAWNYSSVHSPLFRESCFRYVDQIMDWVQGNDTGHNVRGYTVGAEWFYPGSLDYSELAFQAFREWLQEQYGGLSALNAAWGADFEAWGAVEPPRAWLTGADDTGFKTFAFGQTYDLGWLSEPYPVKPRTAYRLEVGDSSAETAEGMALVEIAWFDAAGDLTAISSFETGTGARTATAVSPADAHSVRLVPKLRAPGTASFRDVRLVEAASGETAAAPRGDAWSFHVWFGEAEGEQPGPGLLRITVPEAEMPFERTGVAYEDWVVFSMEAMALWLNDGAAYFKDRDPSRLAVSYIGFVFGHQAHWEQAALMQRLDISLHNAPELDVAGFQLCTAGDDFTWATSNVDMARKYGKPMWCTDLIDFPYGHYSGFTPTYRGSLACAQHGLDGFLWYCWTGVPDYSYYQRMPAPELERLCNDSRAATEALQGFELTTRVAQLMPIQTYSLADPGGYKGDSLDNAGLYHLLLDSGLLPEVYTPYELERGHELSPVTYPVLFIPDCPVLKPEVNQRLVEYVKEGGLIIGTGRPPRWDFAWRELPDALLPEPDRVRERAIGRGRVAWLEDKAGRAYWGEVRRVQEHGNTPPVFVEMPDPGRTPAHQRAARERMVKLMTQHGVAPSVEVDLFSGDVHAAVHENAGTGERVIFLLYKGEGRCPGVSLNLNLDGLPAACNAWLDFDKEQDVDIGPGGSIEVPPFTHACLLRLPAP